MKYLKHKNIRLFFVQAMEGIDKALRKHTHRSLP